MIIRAAITSFEDMFASGSRTLLFKILGTTILCLIGVWFVFQTLIATYLFPIIDGFFPDLPSWLGWLSVFFIIMAAIGSALALAFLVSPISALIAGFFIDSIADEIEQKHYSNDPAGKPLELRRALIHSFKFLIIIVLGNLFALVFFLIPGVNLIVFFVVNGYLLGREYFEFVLLRHHSVENVKILRKDHWPQVFLAGLVIAGFLSIPFLNFLTPFFAAGMMVHLHKMILAKGLEERP